MRRLLFWVFEGYVRLIGRDRCLCRVGQWRLCGRIDDLLIRWGFW